MTEYTKFVELCEIAEANNLVVEIPENPDGERAVWVLPAEDKQFEVGDVQAAMRVAVVATPFTPQPYNPEGYAGQLIAMLKERGYE